MTATTSSRGGRALRRSPSTMFSKWRARPLANVHTEIVMPAVILSL
jgi:hypothetical protein